ncbi:MAG: O-antigen ligase family protein [Magnetococcales bacterium]|nr:O-antigen ligase family protein [Magnetococcales bacterium]MBF0322214.1 O-antigen ligase family protein [Magnetococcales bacterium]
MKDVPEIPNKGEFVESVVFALFLGLIFWMPLPLGSNRPWAWSILEVGIFLLVGLYFLARMGEKKAFGKVFSDHPLEVFLWLAWILIPLLQVVPMPTSLLSVFSQATVEVNRFCGLDGKSMTISLDKTVTLVEWLKYVTYFLAAFLVLAVVDTRDRLRKLTWVIFLSGVFQAVFGMFVFFTGFVATWWLPDIQGSVHGTYVNRNHYAGLLEMSIPMGFGLLLGWMRSSEVQRNFRESLLWVLRNLSSRNGVVSALLVLMFLALFLSTSRGGNIALIVALLTVVALAFLRRRRSNREKRLVLPVVVAALIAGGWMGLGLLADRFKGSFIEHSGRIEVHVGTIEMVEHYPVLGTGSGTFKYVFPIYRTEKVQKFNDHSHNDFLEILATQGVIGFSLFGTSLAASWLAMIRRYLRRRDPFARGVLFAALAGSFSLSIHGLVDFNLQIPANACYFWILIAMGLQASVVPRAAIHESQKKRRREKALLFPSELSRRENT